MGIGSVSEPQKQLVTGPQPMASISHQQKNQARVTRLEAMADQD